MTERLLERIRDRRAASRQKQPFQASLYTRVGTLVREYRLDENFLQRLGEPVESGALEGEGRNRVPGKALLQPGLFFLGSAAEHHLIMSIIEAVNNPYLYFATAPEEVLLSGPLWRQNPRLAEDRLAGTHFAALLRGEQDRR